MVAQNWIKALNTRLAETPSIGAKVGYGALIVSVGVIASAFFIVTGLVKLFAFLVSGTFRNFLNSEIQDGPSEFLPPSKRVALTDGYDPTGPEGPGFYKDGNLVT